MEYRQYTLDGRLWGFPHQPQTLAGVRPPFYFFPRASLIASSRAFNFASVPISFGS